ncbi:MAG: hypothetical protein P4L11_12410 [Geothrix sp.]|nr:hypothetical protein [Geothrix sp.]
MGINQTTGSAVLSYLLFEAGYTRELIALGYADALRQREAIRQFFSVPRPTGD